MAAGNRGDTLTTAPICHTRHHTAGGDGRYERSRGERVCRGSDFMLTIRLLGAPGIERDGLPLRSPRGRKSWALLAYLLLAERPPNRRYLAEMLFSDAD